MAAEAIRSFRDIVRLLRQVVKAGRTRQSGKQRRDPIPHLDFEPNEDRQTSRLFTMSAILACALSLNIFGVAINQGRRKLPASDHEAKVEAHVPPPLRWWALLKPCVAFGIARAMPWYKSGAKP